MTEEPEPLWTVEQVADYLQVPKSTLYGWIYRGTGPPSYKLGRYRRYWISEVDAGCQTS